MEKINIGLFDKKIILQHSSTTRNSAGVRVEVWSNVSEVYADIDFQNKEESKINYDLISQGVITVTTYYIAECNNRWRVNYNGDIYNILHCNQVKQFPYMQLYCTKIMQ